MRIEMKMPDLSANEAEMKVVRWLVDPGQAVRRGQPILEVETDKATVEVEATANGVLAEHRAVAEQEVEVGEVIAVLEVGEAG